MPEGEGGRQGRQPDLVGRRRGRGETLHADIQHARSTRPIGGAGDLPGTRPGPEGHHLQLVAGVGFGVGLRDQGHLESLWLSSVELEVGTARNGRGEVGVGDPDPFEPGDGFRIHAGKKALDGVVQPVRRQTQLLTGFFDRSTNIGWREGSIDVDGGSTSVVTQGDRRASNNEGFHGKTPTLQDSIKLCERRQDRGRVEEGTQRALRRWRSTRPVLTPRRRRGSGVSRSASDLR